jgi:hypothetical protein
MSDWRVVVVRSLLFCAKNGVPDWRLVVISVLGVECCTSLELVMSAFKSIICQSFVGGNG